MTVHLNTCEIYGLWTESNLDDGLLDRGLAPAVALDGGRLEGRPTELRHAELDFLGARDEPPHVVAAAVDLPARRPFVALGPTRSGAFSSTIALSVSSTVFLTSFIMSLRSDSSSTDTTFADTARAPFVNDLLFNH